MILEITDLPIREGQLDAFRAAWKTAERILTRQPGYRDHDVSQQIEDPRIVTLLIKWDSLEAHTERFAKSEDFASFLDLFSSFVDGPVRVVHVRSLTSTVMRLMEI